MKQPIIIGSRGSDLALWQANFVKDLLREQGVSSEIKIIKTQGDRIQHLGFDKMEGKGFFTKEIEAALISGEVDLAVHSHKDLETRPPAGLEVAAVSERANPNEYLLMHEDAYDPLQPLNLKPNAVVGTSAARRKAQLLALRPDLKIIDLRGNVPTRIDKLRKGNYDAILVARAGVDRLNIDLSEFVVEELDPRDFIPAPAQGVLAFQVREDDHELKRFLSKTSRADVAEAIECERSVLRLMDGGCQVPYGGICTTRGDQMKFWAFYANRGGEKPRRLFVDLRNKEFHAETMLDKLSTPRKSKVLITRQMREEGFPRKMLIDAGVDLTECSFIDIEPLKPEAPDWSKFEWMFFTSPNAVKHFPFFEAIPNDLKLCVIGKGTQAELARRNISPEFIGLGKPADVGRVFREELAGNRALIVCGQNGLRSIQNALETDHYDELEVYRRVPKSVEVEAHFDQYVFTSPSNVEAFFESNKIAEGSVVLSIGPSTSKALKARNVECEIAWESSEQALADGIIGLS